MLADIPIDAVLRLSLVSTSLRNSCHGYLQERVPQHKLDSKNPAASYIKYVTVMGDIMRGSEHFIPIQGAMFNAVKKGDLELFEYFFERSGFPPSKHDMIYEAFSLQLALKEGHAYRRRWPTREIPNSITEGLIKSMIQDL